MSKITNRLKELAGLDVDTPRKTLTREELEQTIIEEGFTQGGMGKMAPPLSPSVESSDHMYCPHCAGEIPFEALLKAKQSSANPKASTNSDPLSPEDSTKDTNNDPMSGSIPSNSDVEAEFELDMSEGVTESKKKEDKKEEKKVSKKKTTKKKVVKKKAKKKSSPKVETNTNLLQDLPKEWNVETKETDLAAHPKVDKKVIKILKDKVAHCLKMSQDLMSTGQTDLSNFYKRTSDALQKIHDGITVGDMNEFNKAVMFATSIMGPMQEHIPMEVWQVLTSGGNTGRSLKDYFREVKMEKR